MVPVQSMIAMAGQRTWPWYRYQFTCLLIVATFAPLMTRGQMDQPATVSSGATLRPLASHTVYEASYPLHFILDAKSQAPQPQQPDTANEENEDAREQLRQWTCSMHPAFCNATTTLLALLRHLDAAVDSLQPPAVPDPPAMGRRSFFPGGVGSFLSSCCGVISEFDLVPIYARVRLIDRYLSEQSAVLRQNKEELTTFSVNVSAALDQLRGQVSSLYNHSHATEQFGRADYALSLLAVPKLTSILARALNSIQLRLAMSTCGQGRVPAEYVTQPRLQQALRSLARTLHGRNRTLAHAADDLSFYYSEKIATCALTRTQLHVTVHVPTVRKGRAWEVVEVVPVPFAYQGTMCVLFPDVFLVARDGAVIRPFPASQQAACHRDKLCHLPRHEADMSVSVRCIGAIARNEPISAQAEVCQFQCSPAEPATAVLAIGGDRFVLASTDTAVTATCRGESRLLEVPTTGALLLDVPCDCTVTQGGRVLVHSGFPCDLDGLDHAENLTATVHVPAIWTVLTDADAGEASIPLDAIYYNASELLIDHAIVRSVNLTVGNAPPAPIPPPPAPTQPAYLFHAIPLEIDFGVSWITLIILAVVLKWLTSQIFRLKKEIRVLRSAVLRGRA